MKRKGFDFGGDMQIITCASYYGTGSSAITDFLSEFNNVYSCTDYEFRFAHDPDGLRELEFNLVENFNRHNSGHALKRYKKFVDYYSSHFLAKRYERFFHGEWKNLSYQYIDSLIDFSFEGSWQFDYYDNGLLYDFLAKLPNRIYHAFFHNESEIFLPKMITLASHPNENDFLSKTRDYTNSLMNVLNTAKKPFLMVDQLLPSSNISSHIRYFDNIKVIVVDRDPRDIFLLSKYSWKSRVVPTSDIYKFCKWFDYARSSRKYERWNPQQILFIRFEDMVYKYEETIKTIMSWIGLDEKNHINRRKIFNPDVSIKNTNKFVSNSKEAKNIRIIEKELSEYLYDGFDTKI